MVEVLTLALILSVATAEALLDDDGFEGRSDAVGCEIIPADDDNGNVNGGRRRLRNVFTWPWHAASTAVTSADGSDTSTGTSANEWPSETVVDAIRDALMEIGCLGGERTDEDDDQRCKDRVADLIDTIRHLSEDVPTTTATVTTTERCTDTTTARIEVTDETCATTTTERTTTCVPTTTGSGSRPRLSPAKTFGEFTVFGSGFQPDLNNVLNAYLF